MAFFMKLDTNFGKMVTNSSAPSPTVAVDVLSEQLRIERVSLSNALERLERLRRKLNFFKAIGAARAELRHSDFLAFLLSPMESHGLGDRFVKGWLSTCLNAAKTTVAVTREQVEEWDLTDTEVLREEDRIDLQLINRRLEFAIIVENKTDSGEHSDQLRRYWDTFKKNHKSISKVVGIYLSPKGSVPSDGRYLSVSYKMVCHTIDEVQSSLTGELGIDIKVLLRHYKDLLEIEFMGAQKESSLAWDIHRKFPKAIEFLAYNDPYTQIHREVRRLVDSGAPELVIDHSKKGEIAFLVQEWTKSPILYDPKLGGLLFWLTDFRRELVLSFGVNPEASKAHDSLMSIAKSNPKLFPPAGVGLIRDGWPTVWTKQLLRPTDFNKLNRDEIFDQIEKRWQIFRESDLLKLRASIAHMLR
jgi:hypothetical protein